MKEKMMKSKKSAFILFLFISSLLLGFGYLSFQNNHNGDSYNAFNDDNKKTPKLAQSLSSSDVQLNASIIYRDIQKINVTVNTSAYQDVNDVELIITHEGFEIREGKEMFLVSGTTTNYSQVFIPKTREGDPIGIMQISFRIRYSVSKIDTTDPIANFTVKTNCVIETNNNEFKKSESFYGELIVNNITNTDFDWNVTVSDTELLKKTDFVLGYNITSFRFTINNTFIEGEEYYLRVELINSSDVVSPIQSWLVSYKFSILTTNTAPTINATSISFNPEPLLRTKECNLTFAVSDDSAVSNLDISILIEGPELEKLDFNTNDLNLISSNTFSVNFTISANQSIGTYEVEITATDGAGASDTETAYLKVINNPPKINSFKINGKEINESITVNYGETLRFTFNVTDKEGIDYITVALFNEEADWFNITQQYTTNMNMTIRTVDLAQGTWNVFVFVTDINGETSGLSEDYNIAPKQIKIERRTVEGILPWVMLIMGLVFGGLISIGFASTWMKARWKQKETKEFRKEEPKTTRKSKKKPEKKTVKKPEEEVPEEAEEEKEEKKKKKQTQRKIKRKL